MKKALLLLFILMLAAVGAACGGGTKDVSIDYGASELYTQEDMDPAIALIEKEFKGWKGCELHSISYAGDQCQSADTVDWMNQLKEGQNISGPEFTQVICFVRDFHSPKNSADAQAFNVDQEYTDWQWWLARSDGGKWKLLTWGY